MTSGARHQASTSSVTGIWASEVATPCPISCLTRRKNYHTLLAALAEPARSRQHLAAAHLHLDGFYDQSHFNKEFRTFMGTSPSARLKATLAQATNISDHLLAGELESAP